MNTGKTQSSMTVGCTSSQAHKKYIKTVAHILNCKEVRTERKAGTHANHVI